MGNIAINKYRHRYDQYLCDEILEKCVYKQVSLILKYQNHEFYSTALHYELDVDSPFVVLDSFMPLEGNQLAKKQTEVSAFCRYLNKGTLYHVSFKLILWGIGERKNLPAVYSTPPLEVKMVTEHFVARPTTNNPLWVKIPLFKEEFRLNVSRISVRGLTFEDRLISDSMPALSNISRIFIGFEDETEIMVHGNFKKGTGKTVGFYFENVPEEEMQIIESYLEDIYSTQIRLKIGEARALRRERLKKPIIKVVRVLLLTSDKEYVNRIQDLFKDKAIELVPKSKVESFYEEVSKQPLDVVLIDETFKDLDLWTVSREFQNRFQENEKMPTMMLLSNNITEDSIVYAQYCGINRVIGRTGFLESFLKDIGSVTGRKDLMGEKKEGKPIVVIDDDKNVVFTLEHTLKQHGYQPIIAATGSNGVRLAKDYRPSCIVLEIAVRSGDGLNACRMLKKIPLTKKIPILVLTASRDETEKQAAIQNGVAAYLIKPVETSVILDRIEELIGER